MYSDPKKVRNRVTFTILGVFLLIALVFLTPTIILRIREARAGTVQSDTPDIPGLAGRGRIERGHHYGRGSPQ